MDLRRLRKKRNISMLKLGELVGVTRMTVHNWEKGHTMPDIDDAKRIAQVLGVTLDELANKQ